MPHSKRAPRRATQARTNRNATQPEVLKRWSVGVVAVVFCAIAFVVYGPALRAPFDFDDMPAIVNNPTIQKLWPVTAALKTPDLEAAVSGRPIANLSFAVNVAVNRWLGIQSTPSEANRGALSFHVVNILLHVCSAVLLFLLVRFTISRGRVGETWRPDADQIAGVVAAIWLIHPIQTEAVDYLAQRTELLATFFVLLTLFAGAQAFTQKTRPDAKRAAAWAACAVVSSALGMLSKETAVVAPLLLALYDRTFLYDDWRGAFRSRGRLYALLVAACALPALLVAANARTRTAGLASGTPVLRYLEMQGWAIPHYVALTLWPAQLVHDYGPAASANRSSVVGVAVITVAILASALAFRRDNGRWLGFLGLGFFAALAPSSSVLPISSEFAAERRFYLALAFLAVAVVVGVEALRRRVWPAARTSFSKRRRLAFGIVAVAASLPLMAATFDRSSQYTNVETLWRGSVEFNPNNARALEGLAHAIVERDSSRIEEAEALWRRASTLDSTSATVWVGRAAIAIHHARFADAESLLVRALRVGPGDSAATDKLAAVFLATRRPDRALPLLRRIAERFPGAKSYENLGLAFLSAGQMDSAVNVLLDAVRRDSLRTSALGYLGAALLESGRGKEAVPFLSRAAALDSQPGFPLALLSVAYGQTGQREASVESANQAVRHSPQDPLIIELAGRGLLAAGDAADATSLLERAVALNPRDPEAATRLGMAESALGHRDEARKIMTHVLTVAPGYGLAMQALAQLDARRGHP